MSGKKEERIAVPRSLWHGGNKSLFNIIMDQKAILNARVPPEFNSMGRSSSVRELARTRFKEFNSSEVLLNS